MVNVTLNSGEFYDLGNVKKVSTKIIMGIKLKIIKTDFGELVFRASDKI